MIDCMAVTSTGRTHGLGPYRSESRCMSHVIKRNDCRYCRSTRLSRFLSLGHQPPSDEFIARDAIAREERYPLDVYVCEQCFLVQLLDVVAAERLFGDYAYLASKSKALREHYGRLAQRITARVGLRAGDVVVDIGCNDGVLLAGYSEPGVTVVGVEPSSVADVARAAGFRIEHRFFGLDCADDMVGRYGRARVITATNVFPHVDDIAAFTRGVQRLIADDGIFVIEASYLIDLIDQTLFDTIYHEHLCYLALTPVRPFLAAQGLEVFDVERVDFGASGPAIRIWAQRPGGGRAVEPAVGRMIADEAAWGVGRIDRYVGYAREVERVKTELLDLIGRLKRGGARIGGYGAPAKGSTLLNYAALTPDVIESIAETNERKIGKLTPGSHIPIVSEDVFLSRMPEYALLLSWNYLDYFLAHSEYVRRGGRFIVPIPVPRIVPA
jgi:C-methyltransferase C-terminal domain/Putative zinc binding domain/Methyltransferase domain